MIIRSLAVFLLVMFLIGSCLEAEDRHEAEQNQIATATAEARATPWSIWDE